MKYINRKDYNNSYLVRSASDSNDYRRKDMDLKRLLNPEQYDAATPL